MTNYEKNKIKCQIDDANDIIKGYMNKTIDLTEFDTDFKSNKRTPKKHSYLITRTCPFWDMRESPCKNAYKIGDDWRIDFDDIEELPEITGWDGEFIIKGKRIEIYDDYRE